MRRINPFAAGLLGSLGLLGFYFLTTGFITGNWEFPLRQFLTYRFLMGALVLGFGIQVGLFQHLRLKVGRAKKEVKAAVGTSTGISGISMVACCAHHLTEILPFLGVAGLIFFLSQYQKELLLVGIFSNLVGIIIMIRIIRKVRCQI